jgi:murein DD-endopeptidase MepM/ murein hydrolase activator NlpD
MKNLKIITLLFFIPFFTLNTKAEVEIDNSKYFSKLIDNMVMTKEGLIIGENSSNYTMKPKNGVYIDDKLNLEASHKILAGHKITNIISHGDYYFVTTDNYVNNKIGVYKISKDFSNATQIGKNLPMYHLNIFGDRIYYGGNVTGLWSMKLDGSDNKQLIGDGSGSTGPKITQIKSNSKEIFVVANGPIYKINPENQQVFNIISLVRPSNMLVLDDYILATNNNKLYKVNFLGQIISEKNFNHQINYLTKYLNYIFLTERGSFEQRIYVSNDLGENFYKSKNIYNPATTITSMAFTGTKEINMFVNFYNNGVYKGKFVFDFNNENFLKTPFTSNNPNDLTNKLTSYFDHRYPLLGNLNEPVEYKDTTLNYLGKELKQPFLYYSSHDGIDFGLKLNSNVLAAQEGEAQYFYNEGGLGHAIVIYHPNNYVTVYGHLSEDGLVTRTKTNVVKGQVIGRVGMSGNTSGPHLHFVVYKGSRQIQNKVDPFGWLGNFTDPWSVYNFNFNG